MDLYTKVDAEATPAPVAPEATATTACPDELTVTKDYNTFDSTAVDNLAGLFVSSSPFLLTLSLYSSLISKRPIPYTTTILAQLIYIFIFP